MNVFDGDLEPVEATGLRHLHKIIFYQDYVRVKKFISANLITRAGEPEPSVFGSLRAGAA